ncbi:MAG: metal-sensing transcriptional repressor [Acidimicrobiales bacterium]
MTIPGYRDQGAAVQRRLIRIEDQVRGPQSFDGEDRCCANTLEEISAATRAIRFVTMNLLANNVSHCVKEAWAGRDSESETMVKEAQVAIERLVQS